MTINSGGGVSIAAGLRIQPTTDSFGNATVNIIGGFNGNTVASGFGGQTIAGGGATCGGCVNRVGNDYGTVGGGASNTASGFNSTVSGGGGNTASSNYSTVPGGRSNTAGGPNSFAAGDHANAKDADSFVWCATGGATCGSLGTNSFVVSVLGPIYFFPLIRALS